MTSVYVPVPSPSFQRFISLSGTNKRYPPSITTRKVQQLFVPTSCTERSCTEQKTAVKASPNRIGLRINQSQSREKISRRTVPRTIPRTMPRTIPREVQYTCCMSILRECSHKRSVCVGATLNLRLARNAKRLVRGTADGATAVQLIAVSFSCPSPFPHFLLGFRGCHRV